MDETQNDPTTRTRGPFLVDRRTGSHIDVEIIDTGIRLRADRGLQISRAAANIVDVELARWTFSEKSS